MILNPTIIKRGGGENAAKNDVNFYDYDGTIVKSYSASEFANLTAMPENPSHEGLTAQGWNYTLADAQAYVADYGKLEIGQMYITDDGKTRIYIRLEEGRLAPYLGIAVDGTATVDWGDGSTSTVTGSRTNSVVNTQHTYASAGDYVIAIAVSGKMGIKSFTNDFGSALIWRNAGNLVENHLYRTSVQKVEIGADVIIGFKAFQHCYSLKTVTIPNTVTGSIGNHAFSYCYSLTSVIIPSNVTSLGEYAFYSCYSLASVAMPKGIGFGSDPFQYCYSLASATVPNSVTSLAWNMYQGCYSLASVTIPNSVTSLGQYAFSTCTSLTSVTIPSRVTSIGAQAFYKCAGLGFIKFKRTTPPTVSDSYVFSGIPTDCKIYVPRGTLSAYTSATNYPSSSTYTYVEY